MKIATKGVVTLFNAVAKQQKGIKKEEKEKGTSLKHQKQKIRELRGEGFIKLLKEQSSTADSAAASASSSSSTSVTTKKSATTEQKAGWKILSDDYMMGAKLRQWGVDSDSEEG